MKFDMHVHTRRYSPDANSDPEVLVRRAVEIGLDGLVFTEHDRLWPEAELESLRTLAPNLVLLAGVEVTGRGGDMLCYGVTDLERLPRGLEWGPLTREVHRQGGVCVAAHPYRWGQPFDRLVSEQEAQLDGIEMMSNNMDAEIRARALQYATNAPHFAQLGNSDSHEPDTLGCCYSEFSCEVRSLSMLIEAIQQRKSTPRVRK